MEQRTAAAEIEEMPEEEGEDVITNDVPGHRGGSELISWLYHRERLKD